MLGNTPDDEISESKKLLVLLSKRFLISGVILVGKEHELVEDVDAGTLIKLLKFLKRGKALGPDIIHDEVFMLGTTTSFFHYLTKLFTSSIKLGYIPTA